MERLPAVNRLMVTERGHSMEIYHTLSHKTWERKYHVVFISIYRKKDLYGQLRKHLGRVLKTLAVQKECQIGEGHLLPDHVHMMASIPPKYSACQANMAG